MNAVRFGTGMLAISLLSTAAQAQTNFNEVEPNSVKAEATVAAGVAAGDTLNGTATGATATAGSTLLTSVDTWRVKTAPLPLGIYRHTLAITTSGTAGHTGTIRGLLQSAGVVSTTDTTFQTSSTASVVPRSNTWYAFGKQEEVYWRAAGTASTTMPYVATLSTTTVTPIVVAGTFTPGNVTVTTVAQGHFTDTEIYVYDSALNPIPLGHNDGLTAGDPAPSRVMLNLAAGTYFVAVSVFNTANNQSDLNPTEFWDNDALLDFPHAMACTSTGTNQNVTFTITDGSTSTQVPATKATAFDIVWATFTVGTPATPVTTYCSGDGSGTACPCGNSGLAGNGCATSLNANGANLAGSGVASISSDSFVLTGSGMPNSSALYFQGTVRVNSGLGAVFGDGLRCVAGTVARLGTKTNAGGTSMYPVGGDAPISVKGSNAAGNVRDYQCWFRNADPAFCTPSTFNLTNAIEITWSP